MIDLTKPIRTRDGREAKYLGELPDGRHAFAWQERDRDGDLGWTAKDFAFANLCLFENAPPKLVGFLAVRSDGYSFEWCGSYDEVEARFGLETPPIDLSTLTEKNFVLVKS